MFGLRARMPVWLCVQSVNWLLDTGRIAATTRSKHKESRNYQGENAAVFTFAAATAAQARRPSSACTQEHIQAHSHTRRYDWTSLLSCVQHNHPQSLFHSMPPLVRGLRCLRCECRVQVMLCLLVRRTEKWYELLMPWKDRIN